MIKPQSKKHKGRRLELKVAKLIREILEIDAIRTPLSGGGGIKGDIYCQELPFYFELKNQEKLKIWQWWQEIKDYENPILIISGNRRPILAVCDFVWFLNLLKKYDKTYRKKS